MHNIIHLVYLVSVKFCSHFRSLGLEYIVNQPALSGKSNNGHKMATFTAIETKVEPDLKESPLDTSANCKTEQTPIQVSEKSAEGGNCSEFFRCDRSLFKFKSFFFFFGGAIGSVFPYFSVYYKQIGFSPTQIGLIAGLRPIIGFCSGSLWGSIADLFRIRRIILICSAAGWLAFITSIGFVPPPEKSAEQCYYVNDFVDGNLTFSDPKSSVLKENFNNLHKPRPDITPEEGLLESRGWLYSYDDLYRVYITIMILVVLGELVQAPCGALADSACIEHLGDRNFNRYGHQRAFGSLGLCIL